MLCFLSRFADSSLRRMSSWTRTSSGVPLTCSSLAPFTAAVAPDGAAAADDVDADADVDAAFPAGLSTSMLMSKGAVRNGTKGNKGDICGGMDTPFRSWATVSKVMSV